MTAILKAWRQMEIQTPSIDAYSKNIPAKFHPRPILNDGTYYKNKMGSDMRSGPDLIIE